ncbi:uncharacterized protein AB675_77 [Cyphellophora attinorum]|uniref:Subtelomeric hrmA-associated cluster protein AFUB-079030/YDR124W-like helical bundle domain-containing protein n=1 Tax=Cyphellophora attinorum TaxID=1664694 RepID=A0A0N1H7T4_9EURO|nr:uncharacterized protein AB675_77 [Phialophora attinorum]KPI37762.1 hypothetical protein AB675_77 [Phialophora attinorum]
MKHGDPDPFDIMNPLQLRPRTKRSAEKRQPEMRPDDYSHYVAICLDDEGRAVLKSSKNMKEYRTHILDPEARGRFNHYVKAFLQDDLASTKRPKPRKSSTTQSVETRPREDQAKPYPRKSVKRRHQLDMDGYMQSSYFINDSAMQAEQQLSGLRKMALSISDETAQERWFAAAFKAVQQIGCRTMAKVWIKKIHPKKQSTHPYNGNVPRDSIADANRTKPPYWPHDTVKHKEPDHIDKTERTKLLVHLIINTPQRQIRASSDEPVYIRAVELLAALEEKKGDFKEDKWAIVQEIISVRDQLEEYNSGNMYIDPSATILVSDYETENKSKKNSEPEADEVEADADEQVIVTPASEEPPIAPSPEDQIRQITQSSARSGHDIKPVINHDSLQVAPSEDLDFIPMMDEDDKQMADQQAAFDIQQQMVNRSAFMPMTSSQSHPALTVDTQNLYGFKNASKVGRHATHHAGSMRQKQYSRRDLQQQQEMMLMQSWPNGDAISGGPNSSPNDFLPVEYTFNGAQCATPIPNQTFRMAEVALSSLTDGSSSIDMP